MSPVFCPLGVLEAHTHYMLCLTKKTKAFFTKFHPFP